MENKTKKPIIAKVVKTAMNKSAVVSVERLVKHPVNGKYIKRSTKYHIHDENNKCSVGDVIKIKQCRPISKTKTWILVEDQG
jgi:small subunit ribosomal protein S17|tara:strand:- start:95 stop:340 length:246 start_codon:yes stop_codon:yes gene_type:complete